MKATKLIKAYFGLPAGSAPSRRPVGAHRALDDEVGDSGSEREIISLAARRAVRASAKQPPTPNSD